ncbi:hypothetical protein RCL1_008487 [Eukaryota sp. TZLM3-RCL]
MTSTPDLKRLRSSSPLVFESTLPQTLLVPRCCLVRALELLFDHLNQSSCPGQVYDDDLYNSGFFFNTLALIARLLATFGNVCLSFRSIVFDAISLVLLQSNLVQIPKYNSLISLLQDTFPHCLQALDLNLFNYSFHGQGFKSELTLNLKLSFCDDGGRHGTISVVTIENLLNFHNFSKVSHFTTTSKFSNILFELLVQKLPLLKSLTIYDRTRPAFAASFPQCLACLTSLRFSCHYSQIDVSMLTNLEVLVVLKGWRITGLSKLFCLKELRLRRVRILDNLHPLAQLERLYWDYSPSCAFFLYQNRENFSNCKFFIKGNSYNQLAFLNDQHNTTSYEYLHTSSFNERLQSLSCCVRNSHTFARNHCSYYLDLSDTYQLQSLCFSFPICLRPISTCLDSLMSVTCNKISLGTVLLLLSKCKYVRRLALISCFITENFSFQSVLRLNYLKSFELCSSNNVLSYFTVMPRLVYFQAYNLDNFNLSDLSYRVPCIQNLKLVSCLQILNDNFINSAIKVLCIHVNHKSCPAFKQLKLDQFHGVEQLSLTLPRKLSHIPLQFPPNLLFLRVLVAFEQLFVCDPCLVCPNLGVFSGKVKTFSNRQYHQARSFINLYITNYPRILFKLKVNKSSIEYD